MDRQARQAVTFGITGAIVAMALVAAPDAQGRMAPQGHLARAADAVLKLKSAQFTLTREGTPAFLDEKNGHHVHRRGVPLRRAGPRLVQRQDRQQDRDDPPNDARVGARRRRSKAIR